MVFRAFPSWSIFGLLIALAGCARTDPVETAIKNLNNPAAIVRRESADKLSLEHDPRAVEPLIVCLKDQDMEVRKAAARALGSLKDARAIEPLIVCLTADDTEFHTIVIASLGRLDGAQVGQRLLSHLQAKEAEYMKSAVIEALGAVHYAGAVEALIPYLVNKDDEISRQTLEALGQIGAPAVPPLIARLNDPDVDVRASAAEALGRIGDARAIEPLIARLKHPTPETAGNAVANANDEKAPAGDNEEQTDSQAEKDSQVRQKAADALGKSGPPAVEPLIACLNEVDPSVRSLAATALGQLHDSRAIKPLIACMVELAGKNTTDEENSNGVNLQDSVSNALANLGEPAIKALLPYLQDKDIHVRQDAADVLSDLHYVPPDNEGKIPFFILRRSWDELVKLGAPAVAPLLDSLKDEDADMRQGAAQALGQLNDKRAVKPLITCLQDESIEVKQNAARALGLLGDKRAVEPLIKVFNDEIGEVKKSAAEALGLLGDSQAIAPLLTGLTDEDSELRQTCAQALQKLNYKPAKVEDNVAYLIALKSWDEAAKLGPPAYEPLVACLSDMNTDVKESAIEALGHLGDKRAIEPLSKALPDWNLNAALVSALEQLGWKPTSDAEQVYTWIAKKNSEQLKKEWGKTRKVLLDDVGSNDHQKIENAVYSFMAIGDGKIIDDLVQILDDQGDKDIAETYLNCGNEKLAQAARDWASKNGYQTIPIPGGGHMQWGSW
ncbi:MAG: HEAT repeat domain-containing protein [Verrucomicrobiota bacterium]|nr:HEAT repeat domain-containing protein [Verrucomicrobiota bacterium]